MRLRWSTTIVLFFALTIVVSACGSDSEPQAVTEHSEPDAFREIGRTPVIGEGNDRTDEDAGQDVVESDGGSESDVGYDNGYDYSWTDSGGGSVVPVCGNGVLEGVEECDGNQFYVGSCASFGWTGSGELTCNDFCLLEAAACDTGLCGNGEVDSGEECDGGPSREEASCFLDCTSAGLPEVEPNDTLGGATLIDCEPGTECRARGTLDLYDIDVFKIQVDEPADLLAWVDDGRGGCPDYLDTTLTLMNGDNTQLAYDDDSYSGSCSQISPDAAAGAALHEAGDYYLQVQGYYDDNMGPYTIHVLLTLPVCGDGRLSAGEECDDGDTRIGDGCDAVCHYEASDEEEPNDSPTDANGPYNVLGASSIMIRGSIAPAGDEDVFALPMGYGDTFSRIDIIPLGGECPFEVEVELIGPDETTVLDGDSYDYSMCASMTETSNPKISNLSEGTHYVLVRSYGGHETGDYLLALVGRQLECGDGKREGDEMCDDANDDDTDGCANCELDVDGASPEVEPNDSLAAPQSLGLLDESTDIAIVADLSSGDEDFFEIELIADARVEAWLSDGMACDDFDTKLYFYDATATDTIDYLVYDDDGGEGYCSRLDRTDDEMNGLAAGKYVLRVTPFSSDTGIYILQISVTYPSCGDGIIGGNEICDDENVDDGDGCSSECIPEGDLEVEPNNELPLSSDPIDMTTGDEVMVIGSIFYNIGDSQDIDLFEITVADNAQVGALVWNGSGGCRVDSDVSLLQDAETVLRPGVGLGPDKGCWQVGGDEDPYGTGEELAAGTYYVRVAGKGGDMGPYQLVLWAEYPE